MRLFDIVVFLALLGAVSGAFQYVQEELSTQGDGVNWWSGYSVQNMDTVVVDTSTSGFNNANAESNIPSTIEDIYNGVYFILGMIWNMIKGIVWIKGVILDKVIVYMVDGVNILEPINYIIQVGIYIMAYLGWAQMKKQPMGSGY